MYLSGAGVGFQWAVGFVCIMIPDMSRSEVRSPGQLPSVNEIA